MSDLSKYIREVPDFPKPGVRFYDITSLLSDQEGFKLALEGMAKFIGSREVDTIVAAESRGFIFGSALADRLGYKLVLARKPGKLPAATVSASYELEYGTDSLEIHADAIAKGEKVVIVDDLIATGGTLVAVCQMVEQLGGVVQGISTLVELSFLPWREKLSAYDVDYLVSYDSE